MTDQFVKIKNYNKLNINSQKSNKTAEDLKVNKKENLKNNLKGLNILKNLKAQRQNKFGGS